jgi:hypothetical protein
VTEICETITWRPIAELTPGRMALLKAPTNNLGRRETVFFGYAGGTPLNRHFLTLFFEYGQPRQMMIQPTHFAYVEGM